MDIWREKLLKKQIIFINIWFALRRLNKYIFYGKGFLKARRPPKVYSEMKCTNEWMTWNTEGYEPELICTQG